MSENNKDKVVLITGASSGIGRAVAFKFAKHGFKLAITYNKNQDGIIQTAQTCKSLGSSQVEYFRLDLADDESIRNCVKQVIKKYNKINILINNAATIKHVALLEENFSAIDHQIKTNLSGHIKLTKKFLLHIEDSIINIGSTISKNARANLSIYCASKTGLLGFSKSVAKELPQIKVYHINPPMTQTRMVDYKGMHPSKVAEVVYNIATGEYKAKSGSQVDVRDYRFGKFWKNFLVLAKYIKR